MIKHIVFFKIKEGESVEEAKKVLLSMKGIVPEIVELEVGTDFLHSARSFDLALTVTVKDKKALDNYQKNEYHCGVVKPHMHRVRCDSAAVDYEI